MKGISMPISTAQRQRLERALNDHEAALTSNERKLTSSSARVHEILLELGRNERVLTLIADFVDSPTVSHDLRRNAASELTARGIDLPDGVVVRVIDSYGGGERSILRFEVSVGNATVLADWDPDAGACVRLARPPLDSTAATSYAP
jgi:hypothetical protein